MKVGQAHSMGLCENLSSSKRFFFLPFLFSFFFSLPNLLSVGSSSILLDLHLHCQFVLGLSSETHLAHVAIPCHRPISPSPPSHRQSKLHCQPKLHCRSKLHRHCLHQTQELCETDLGRNEAEEFGFGGVVGFHGFRGLVVVWLCWW